MEIVPTVLSFIRIRLHRTRPAPYYMYSQAAITMKACPKCFPSFKPFATCLFHPRIVYCDVLECASTRKRLMSSSSREDLDEAEKQFRARTQIFFERPTFRSFLKLKMDKGTNKALAMTAIDIQRDCRRSALHSRQFDRIVKLKPRAASYLYISLFFGGDTMDLLPGNIFQEWRGKVTAVLNSAGFQMEGPGVPQNMTPDEWSFTFKGLEVCQPDRNHLVKLCMGAQSPWYELHRDIREIGRSLRNEDLDELVEDDFDPMVILGNIKAHGNRILRDDQLRLIEKIVKQRYELENQYGTWDYPARVTQIIMGGPMFGQPPLTFNYVGSNYQQSEEIFENSCFDYD